MYASTLTYFNVCVKQRARESKCSNTDRDRLNHVHTCARVTMCVNVNAIL